MITHTKPAETVFNQCPTCGNDYLPGAICTHPKNADGQRIEAAAKEYARQIGADHPVASDRMIAERMLRAADLTDERQGLRRIQTDPVRRTPDTITAAEHQLIRALRKNPTYEIRLIKPSNGRAVIKAMAHEIVSSLDRVIQAAREANK